jgi:ATP synthase F1 delta subunit
MIYYSYVNILFKVAKNQGKIDQIGEQFEILMSIIDDYPEWIKLLDAPVLSFNQKKKKLKELNLFGALFTRFLLVLIRQGHVRELPKIYNEWVSRSSLDQKIAFIQLYAAKELTNKQLEIIKEDVKPMFGDLKVEFNIHIEPELISGVRLYYQGESIERSTRKELENLFGNL